MCVCVCVWCVCVVCVCVCVCVLYPGLDGNHLMQMAEAINCCYARTAVHTIVLKLYGEKGGVKQLTAQHMPQLIKDYNALFDAMPAMQLTTQKHSIIKKLMVLFYSHWDVQNQKEEFLHIFSFDEWSKISLDKQKQHTIRKCTEHIVCTFLICSRVHMATYEIMCTRNILCPKKFIFISTCP